MTKAGDIYQEAVAEVARTLDSAADIQVGAWVQGPDGRRDLDVAIRPRTAGAVEFVLIECKDWNRPVGIAAIDALESKRRDINARVAMICSNSGFTSDAIRKAARVGIPVLCALIEGDSRIRVEVREEIYTRKIQVTGCESSFHFLVPNVKDLIPSVSSAREILYADRPVAAWIRDRCMGLIGMASQSGNVTAKYKFKQPITLRIRDVVLPAIGCDLTVSWTLQWCSQTVQIDASTGMYDYLRRRVVLGAGVRQYHLKNVDFDKWMPVDFIPEHLLDSGQLRPNEASIALAIIDGLDGVDNAHPPPLNEWIESEEVVRR